jgi:hypothetical protein
LARGLSDSEAVSLGNDYAGRLDAAKALGGMTFSAEARRVYEGIYADLTEDRGGLYGVVVSRAEVQVIRVAMIYAALDGKAEIQVEHLHAALAIIDYCDASARRLFAGHGHDALEVRVIEALASGPKSRTELNHDATVNLGQGLSSHLYG